MLEKLRTLKIEELKSIIDPGHLELILELTGKIASTRDEKGEREILARYILAIHGNDVLCNSQVRQSLVASLSVNQIQRIAKQLGVRNYSHIYDLTAGIAASPWRYGSRAVSILARELGLPQEYLPTKAYTLETVEYLEPIEALPDLFPYQQAMMAELLNRLYSPGSRVLLQMPTGAGKTRTVIEALIKFIIGNRTLEAKESVLWLANTEELCEQAIESLRDVWERKGDRSLRVVRLWGSHNPNTYELNGAFVVSSLQKLYGIFKRKPEYFDDLKKATSCLVIDEAHSVLAPTYKTVIGAIVANERVVVIGMTATPGRSVEKDIENVSLSKLFHRSLIRPAFDQENAIEALREMRILSRIVKKEQISQCSVTLTDGELEEACEILDIPRTILSVLERNRDRNRLIVKTVLDELKLGHPCLVFACSVEHARVLSTAVVFSGQKAGYVDSSMRRGTRRRVIEKFRSGEIDALFNYGILSTGFDVPRIRSVIIARPTNSLVLYSQMIGRGLRGPLMGGTDICNLIDIKDNFENFGNVEDVYDYFSGYWALPN